MRLVHPLPRVPNEPLLGRFLRLSAQLRLKILLDLLVWTSAVPLAFVLRLDFQLARIAQFADEMLTLVFLVALPMALLLEWRGQLYRQTWRRANFEELGRVVVSVGLFWLALTIAQLAMPAAARVVSGVPRSVPPLASVLALAGLVGLRFARRVQFLNQAQAARAGLQHRVLIVGAGAAGSMIARELYDHPELNLEPVGFLDDDPSKDRVTLRGLPVLGRVNDLPAIAKAHGITEVIIAAPSAQGSLTRRVFELTRGLDVRHRVMPGLYEVLGGRVKVDHLRDVQIEDLLGRETVTLDPCSIAGYLEGRAVLVTGAGGSIGSEVVRQIARFQPRCVILLGRGENSVFGLERELDRDFPELQYASVIQNVQDREGLSQAFARFQPDVVFHAAAHKHVPFMEANPAEAIRNNVLGTRNVVDLCLEHGVRRLVNISTDKAVNPTSVMGATKRVGEMIVSEAASRATADQAFVSVRFGNVLGSRGSVIPLFLDQIRRGGPVTVTSPDMVRYFMTIPEASSLVLQAGGVAESGSVYVLNMGQLVRIVDLAQNLIRLSGAKDMDVVFTGARAGEKLFEELLTDREGHLSTAHEKIFVAPVQVLGRDLLELHLERLEDAAAAGDPDAVRDALARVVPEYTPCPPLYLAPQEPKDFAPIA